MLMEKKKYFSESSMIDKPKKKLSIGIKDGSITTDKLKDEAITTKKIAQNSIDSSVVKPGGITRDCLEVDAIGTKEIEDGSVTTSKLATESVTNEKLATGAVDTPNIANLAIISGHIYSNAILTRHLASGVVTVEKIAEEVWNKLKEEYLRLDGENAMGADLNMSDNSIVDVNSIYSYIRKVNNAGTKQNCIELFDEDGGISLVRTNVASGRVTRNKCSMDSVGYWTSTGFKTTDQSSFGLLGNEGSVVIAMSDSDVDACMANVFG